MRGQRRGCTCRWHGGRGHHCPLHTKEVLQLAAPAWAALDLGYCPAGAHSLPGNQVLLLGPTAFSGHSPLCLLFCVISLCIEISGWCFRLVELSSCPHSLDACSGARVPGKGNTVGGGLCILEAHRGEFPCQRKGVRYRAAKDLTNVCYART